MVAEVPPPDAFTVIVFVVLDAFLPTVIFIVVVPGADRELDENVTAPVTVPESVIVELPDDPRVTVSEVGEAEIV